MTTRNPESTSATRHQARGDSSDGLGELLRVAKSIALGVITWAAVFCSLEAIFYVLAYLREPLEGWEQGVLMALFWTFWVVASYLGIVVALRRSDPRNRTVLWFWTGAIIIGVSAPLFFAAALWNGCELEAGIPLTLEGGCIGQK